MRSHGGEGFVGDRELLARQMAERDVPQSEESPEERLAREAYDADQAEAKSIQEQASQFREEVGHRRGVEEKLARDAAQERKVDSTNYVYGSDGKLYFMDPATGKTYRKSDYGNQFIPVKSIPVQSERDALNEAFARTRSRKTNSVLPF